MVKLQLTLCILIIDFYKSNQIKFPSDQDFDFVENLLDNWKIQKPKIRTESSRGSLKIGSYAPSSTRLVESIESAYPEPDYHQQPGNYELINTVKYQPESQYSSVPHSYGQPMVPSYPDPHYYHPHHHPSTDHHYYHHNHGSNHHHHETEDQHSHQSESSSSTSTSQPIVRQQTIEPTQKVIQYVPLAINPKQSNRSPTTSPWLWSLLFIIIFPTLLGAILLPLALVFLTNVVFVLLMLRNNNQQTTIIPNNQNRFKSRSLTNLNLNEEMVQNIFKLIHKANVIYGQTELY